MLLVLTEWPEFEHLDYKCIRDGMRQPVLVDGRNLLDPARMRAAGFRYRGVGRGVPPESGGHARLPLSRLTLAA